MPTETARVPAPIATGSLPWEGCRRDPQLRLALAPPDPRRVGAGLPHRRGRSRSCRRAGRARPSTTTSSRRSTSTSSTAPLTLAPRRRRTHRMGPGRLRLLPGGPARGPLPGERDGGDGALRGDRRAQPERRHRLSRDRQGRRSAPSAARASSISPPAAATGTARTPASPRRRAAAAPAGRRSRRPEAADRIGRRSTWNRGGPGRGNPLRRPLAAPDLSRPSGATTTSGC